VAYHLLGAPTSACWEDDKLESELWSLAEDDAFRSNYIRSLIKKTSLSASVGKSSGTRIPKEVIQFWHDMRNVPPDVHECLDSWVHLKGTGFTRTLFDDERAAAFIDRYFSATHKAAFDRCFHPAMRCDYFRLCYILQRGGFYVDADESYQGTDYSFLYESDVLKISPLCYDTENRSMIPARIFFSDPTASSGRIYYVNNNPIIAPPRHPLVERALERATKILTSRPDIQSTTGDWKHGRESGFPRYGGSTVGKA
jgi:mannosyltransferase OCH1-like enzyme